MSSMLPFPNNLEVHLAVLVFAKVCLSKCSRSLHSSAFTNGDCSNIWKFQNSFALAVPTYVWNSSFYCGNQALQVSSFYFIISYTWYSLEAHKSSQSMVNSLVSMQWHHVGGRLLNCKLRQNLSSNRMRLAAISGGHLVQASCLSRSSIFLSSWFLSIPRGGDSATSLGNLRPHSFWLQAVYCTELLKFY